MRWRDILYPLVIVILIAVIIILAVEGGSINGKSRKVALVDIQGTIADTSEPFQTTTTPDKVRSLTKKALSQGVEGIIYRINSPGGTVVTSKDVFRVINGSSVPTTCLMKDYATSGAYWASLGCDKIIADPMTVTGNIGAKSSYLEFSGLLNELGVEYVNLTSGKFKDMGSPLRNITEEEREIMLSNLNHIEDEFLTTVQERRNLSSQVRQELSEGGILLGRRAEKLNLVDYLGGRRKAKEIMKQLADLEQVEIVKMEQERGLTDLLSRLFVRLGAGIGQSLNQAQGSRITAKYS